MASGPETPSPRSTQPQSKNALEPFEWPVGATDFPPASKTCYSRERELHSKISSPFRGERVTSKSALLAKMSALGFSRSDLGRAKSPIASVQRMRSTLTSYSTDHVERMLHNKCQSLDSNRSTTNAMSMRTFFVSWGAR